MTTDQGMSGEQVAVDDPKKNFVTVTSDDPVKATETEPAAAAEAKEPKNSPEQDDDEDDQQDSNDDHQGTKRKRRGGFQTKIAKLEAERDFYLKELERSRSGGQKEDVATVKKPDDATGDEEPVPRDDEDLLSFNKRMIKWNIDQARKQDAKEAEKKANLDKQAQTFKAKVDKLEASKKAAAEAYPDYQESVEQYAAKQFTPQFQMGLLESDQAGEVIYYLTKNPTELETLNNPSLTVEQVLRTFGKIEGKIEASKSSGEKVGVTTKAPPPIKPVGNKTSAANGYASRFYEGMPNKEYAEWRSKNR